jgi:hypothetical protein
VCSDTLRAQCGSTLPAQQLQTTHNSSNSGSDSITLAVRVELCFVKHAWPNTAEPCRHSSCRQHDSDSGIIVVGGYLYQLC